MANKQEMPDVQIHERSLCIACYGFRDSCTEDVLVWAFELTSLDMFPMLGAGALASAKKLARLFWNAYDSGADISNLHDLLDLRDLHNLPNVRDSENHRFVGSACGRSAYQREKETCATDKGEHVKAKASMHSDESVASDET
eukprot:3487175-Pleurochrysis_carterae.AAC.2